MRTSVGDSAVSVSWFKDLTGSRAESQNSKSVVKTRFSTLELVGIDACFEVFSGKKSWCILGIFIFRTFFALFRDVFPGSTIHQIPHWTSEVPLLECKGRIPSGFAVGALFRTSRKSAKKVRKMKIPDIPQLFFHWKPQIKHHFPPTPELKIKSGWPIFHR